jgi:hypothetical protein
LSEFAGRLYLEAIERERHVLDSLAELYAWREPGDGYVSVPAAAEAMGVPVAEVVRLARQGALAVRGDYVRPALVAWIAVR